MNKFILLCLVSIIVISFYIAIDNSGNTLFETVVAVRGGLRPDTPPSSSTSLSTLTTPTTPAPTTTKNRTPKQIVQPYAPTPSSASLPSLPPPTTHPTPTTHNTTTTETRTPKIVHQSWKSRDLPASFKKWRQSCVDLNPDWEFRVWTDKENRELVKDHYPHLLKLYDTYDVHIKRIDMVRYLYLHKVGGVYIDLDFACLAPFGDLFEGKEMVSPLAAYTIL